jgi:hypothetical protein
MLMGDGFRCPTESTAFWRSAARRCTPSRLDVYFPLELKSCIQRELECQDITQVSSSIFVGDHRVATSRVSLNLLSIKGVVLLGNDSKDAAAEAIPWATSDGIAVHCCPIDARRADLAKCCSFIEAHQPAIIAGSAVGAVVCAAFLSSQTKGRLGAGAALKLVEARRGPLNIELDHLCDLCEYIASLPRSQETNPYVHGREALSEIGRAPPPPPDQSSSPPLMEGTLHVASHKRALPEDESVTSPPVDGAGALSAYHTPKSKPKLSGQLHGEGRDKKARANGSSFQLDTEGPSGCFA